MWFTIATEPDSELGLEGTLDVLKDLAGAESVRQLPTLKLFKIRMDLEMAGDTDALARSAEAVEPAETERQPYDELDRAVIRATRATCRSSPSPTRAARELGMPVERLVEHLEGWSSAGCCAAWRRSCSTAGRASAPTAWACGASPRTASSRRVRGWRRSAGSATATSARPTPTGPTSSSRWPTGAPRRSATPSSTRSRRGRLHRAALDAVLVDGVQEGPPAVLHRRLQELGSASTLVSVSISDARPPSCTPARCAAPGRRQLAGARDARDRPRPALRRARRGRRARRRRRQPLRRLRLLVGSADPRPRAPGGRRRRHRGGRGAGRASARRPPARSSSPRRSPAAMPAVEMLRMTSSGTEASMSAIRLARAATGRDDAAEVRRRLPRPRRRAARARPARAWRRRASRPAPACRRPRRAARP